MHGLTLQEFLLMQLIHQPHPIGPDDRFPVDRLALLAALHGVAQRLELPAVADAVGHALREQVEVRTRSLAA